MPSCQFFHFSIYNSVRFVYVSFTLLFTLFFSFHACQNPGPAILPCHLCHLWHLIGFKGIFLAKTLAKTCYQCRQNGKSLISKGFLFVKCVMSLFDSTLPQIIITMLLYITLAIIRRLLLSVACHYPLAYNNATIYSNAIYKTI